MMEKIELELTPAQKGLQTKMRKAQAELAAPIVEVISFMTGGDEDADIEQGLTITTNEMVTEATYKGGLSVKATEAAIEAAGKAYKSAFLVEDGQEIPEKFKKYFKRKINRSEVEKMVAVEGVPVGRVRPNRVAAAKRIVERKRKEAEKEDRRSDVALNREA